MSPAGWLLAVVVVLLTLTNVRPSWADACGMDNPCPEGFVCVTPPGACRPDACDDNEREPGEECPEPDDPCAGGTCAWDCTCDRGAGDPCAGANCDDGDLCTADFCSVGQCIHGAVDCGDDETCTDDACFSATGCTHALDTSNDGCIGLVYDKPNRLPPYDGSIAISDDQGRHETVLPLSKRNKWNCDMSPDGRALVCSGDELLVWDIATGVPRLLRDDILTHYARFMPNGSQLLLERVSPLVRLKTIDLLDSTCATCDPISLNATFRGRAATLGPPSPLPEVSPLGTQIAFRKHNRALYVMDSDGQNQRQIIPCRRPDCTRWPSTLPRLTDVMEPSFVGSNRVVFMGANKLAASNRKRVIVWNVMSANLDGSDVRMLTDLGPDDSQVEGVTARGDRFRGFSHIHPLAVPNGSGVLWQKLFNLVKSDGSYNGWSCEMWRMDADGGNKQMIMADVGCDSISTFGIGGPGSR